MGRRTNGWGCAAGSAVAVLSAAVFLIAQDKIDPNELRASSAQYLPRPRYTLRTEARLVEVGVVVRDSRGRAVGGLQKSDFEVRDAGKKREISAFSVHTFTPAASARESDSPSPPAPEVLPRFVGLLFDDLNSSLGEFRYAQVAAERFVKEGLAPGDRVAVFNTYGQQIIPFTADVPRLVEAIEGMRVRTRTVDGGGCPRMTPYDSYLIANNLDSQSLETKVAEAKRCNPYLAVRQPQDRSRSPQSSQLSPMDPVVTAVMMQARSIWLQVRWTSQSALDAIQSTVDYMAAMPGSRTLLLASGGFLTGTLESEQNRIIIHALQGAVVINSLDAKGLYAPDAAEMPTGGDIQSIIRAQSLGTRPKEDGNSAMAYLAQSTGGLFFHNSNDLDRGFRELGVLPEVTYVLGFAPPAGPDGRYHKLNVRLTGGNRRSVQARPGYYAPKEEAAQPSPERKIDREVLAAGTLNEIPAWITASPGKLESGTDVVNVDLHVDVRRLRFLDQSGVRAQRLTFIAALLDERGNFVTGREGVLDMALKEGTFARLSDRGLTTALQLEVPPGTYRLRGVIEEAREGQMTTSIQTVEIP
jgi:VWFA-related protein